MKNFLLVTRNMEVSRDWIDRLKAVIASRGGSLICLENPQDSTNPGTIPVPENTDGILTLGGDGTMIRAAQNTLGSGVPLIGINGGHLGYLCDLDPDGVDEAIDLLMEDRYEIESRMLLAGMVYDAQKKPDLESVALNDVVIVSRRPMEILCLTVYVNGQPLYTYHCDGMIFATPTGSTAYNLSAKGPIVDPKTRLILLTPINPHTLNSRSIVLDPNDIISVKLTARREGDEPVAEVSFDGNHRRQLVPGEELVVYRSREEIKMMKLSKMNFLERIRNKMQSN